jgi:putative PIN family toxin of toxin-antitoxin system
VRVVLDTNVLVSGIFFGGLPGRLLDAWADGRLELVLSPAILDEYLRVCERIAESRPALEYESVLTAIAGHGVLVADPTWDEPITVDPADDKFILCARSADAVVVSGDSDLLEVSGWEGVHVLKPRDLLDQLGDSAAV